MKATDVFKKAFAKLYAENLAELLRYGKPRWPLVCTRCGGQRWASVCYENKRGGGDYCFDCKDLVRIDFITREQYIKLYNSNHDISPGQFKAMWDPEFSPKEGYC